MADTIDFPEFRAAAVFAAEGGRVAEFAFEKGSLGLPEAIPQAESITRDGQGSGFSRYSRWHGRHRSNFISTKTSFIISSYDIDSARPLADSIAFV